MSIIRGIHIQQHLVFIGAAFNKIQSRLSRIRPIRIINHDDAILRKERLGDLQALQLIIVAVLAIIYIEADGGSMDPGEIFHIVHIVEMMPFALQHIKSRQKVLLRAAELGKIIYPDAGLPGIPDHSCQERKTVPHANVHKTRAVRKGRYRAINHCANGERGHLGDRAQGPKSRFHALFLFRNPGVGQFQGNTQERKGRQFFQTSIPAEFLVWLVKPEIDALDIFAEVHLPIPS